MTVQRSIVYGAALGAAMMLAAAAGLAAQQRPLFEWRGRVDRDVELVMRGRSLQLRNVGWMDRLRDRPRVYAVLPHEDGYVSVRRLDGRGRVDVVQQPDRGNDYTAVIRISDDRSGADEYRVQAFWQPARGGWGYGNGGRDRDNGGWDRDNGGWNRGDGDRDDHRDHDRWNNGRGDDDGRWNNGAWGSGHGVLHWSGRVDDQVDLRIQGRDVRTINVSGDGTRGVRSSLDGALPPRDVSLRVDKREGRGQVDVIQQPSSWNGYTAVVRIRDGRAGSDYYNFDVTW